MEGDGAHLAVFNRMTRDGLTEMACEQRREADEEVSCEKPWQRPCDRHSAWVGGLARRPLGQGRLCEGKRVSNEARA